MKSTSPPQAQNTGTHPLISINVILYSALSDDANSSQALPQPTKSDSPETRAVMRKRLLMVLALAIALIDEDEDEDEDYTDVIDESNTTLTRRSMQ